MALSEKWLYAANMVATKINRWFNKPTIHNCTEIESILIVKLDEIGDMATSVHVFSFLKKQYPNAKITLLCKPFVKSLVQNDHNIDSIITELADIKSKFDIWVELRGNWETFFKSLLNCKKYRVDRGTVRFTQRGNQQHEILTNYRVIENLLFEGQICASINEILEHPFCRPTLYPSKEEMALANQRIAEFGLTRFAVIHPSARRILRQWPAERFAEIAKFLYSEFQITPLIIGTNDEVDCLNKIKNMCNECEIWVSNDSLLTLYAVMQQSDVFIGNESGPLQLADLANIPCVGLFGPGVKNVFYPQNKMATVLHHVLECNPCDQLHCTNASKPCIEMIEVQTVKMELKKLLFAK
jgi:ADP-heptose:LPS heptosyltransferase